MSVKQMMETCKNHLLPPALLISQMTSATTIITPMTPTQTPALKISPITLHPLSVIDARNKINNPAKNALKSLMMVFALICY
jgi:hypothetical protein